MSITENSLILVLHVTLVLPLEGILLQNQDCTQCIAPLEHQVALLQQRLETLEQIANQQPVAFSAELSTSLAHPSAVPIPKVVTHCMPR
uniref:Uncharacterized protein n=1 Tax=Magallana gigas TaxID=29159 RepID=A0A8W8I0D8_MAGGI